MPLILDDVAPQVVNGRMVRLADFPDFNGGDPAFKITDFDGWFDGPTPQPVLVANGGAAGAMAVGTWDPAEAYYTLTGRIFCAPEDKAPLRRLLLAAVPYAGEVPIQVFGNDVDDDLQAFVRLYDRPTITVGGAPLSFVLPLVNPEGVKYAVEPLTGLVGPFSDVDWYRTYDVAAAPSVRRYAQTGGSWSRTYVEPGQTGAYATELGLTSPGDTASRRVTVAVNGPLAQGWWMENTTTGDRVWSELALDSGQSLVYDSRLRSAHLDGTDVSHLTFGDYLTLEPGPNTFRLIGEDTVGYASVQALPAYL